MCNGRIKIITGIRRCGKSYLLSHVFKDYLHAQGMAHIIEISLDQKESEAYRNNSQRHAITATSKPLILLLPHFYLTGRADKTLRPLHTLDALYALGTRGSHRACGASRADVTHRTAADAAGMEALAVAVIIRRGVHAAAILKTIDIAHLFQDRREFSRLLHPMWERQRGDRWQGGTYAYALDRQRMGV